MNTLLIVADLVNPPTDSLAFRNVTFVSKKKLSLSIILEVECYAKDIYFHWCRNRGLLDYIDQFITKEEKESAIRIDSEIIKNPTVKTDRICFENQLEILGKIKSFI